MFRPLLLTIAIIVVLTALYLIPVDLSLLRPAIELPLTHMTSAETSLDNIILYRLSVVNIKNLNFKFKDNVLALEDIFLYLGMGNKRIFSLPIQFIIKNISFAKKRDDQDITSYLTTPLLDYVNFSYIDGMLLISPKGIAIDNFNASSRDASLKIRGGLDLLGRLDVKINMRLSKSSRQFQDLPMEPEQVDLNITGTVKRPIISGLNLSIRIR